jgi:hypothetical protein
MAHTSSMLDSHDRSWSAHSEEISGLHRLLQVSPLGLLLDEGPADDACAGGE